MFTLTSNTWYQCLSLTLSLLSFDQEFFLQTMWAVPLSQVFLHLLYDKEILDESVILQWYSRKPTGGEDSGFEPQRKHLRQQVCALTSSSLNSAYHFNRLSRSVTNQIEWFILKAALHLAAFRATCLATVFRRFRDKLLEWCYTVQ